MTFCVKKFNGLLFSASAATAVDYLMSLTGTMVAGNVLGEKALGGYNLMSSPMSFLMFLSMLIALGTSILFSEAVGRFDDRRASQLYSCGLLGSVGVGVVFAVLLLLFRDAYLGFMNGDAETLGHTRDYWGWFVLVALVQPFTVFLNSMVYCDGDNAVCLTTYPIKLIVNGVASYLLCRAIGLGGCALGNFLGNVAAIGVYGTHFLKKANSLKFTLFFSFKDICKMAYSAFGDACVQFCWAILYFILNKFFIARFGVDMLPVVAAVLAATNFTQIFDGMGNAIQPLIGVYAGEMNYRCVRTVMKAAEIAALVEGGVVAMFLLIWPEAVLRMVGLSSPELVGPACGAIRIMGCSFVFWAMVFLFNSYYLFVNKALVSCLLTLLKDLLFPAAMLLAGGMLGGIYGLWWGYALAAPVATGVFCLLILAKYGRGQFPLLLTRDRDAKTFVWNLELEEVRICGVSAELATVLRQNGADERVCGRAALLTEEVLMAIKDRNADRSVLSEVTLDLNDGISLVMRDDGVIFDITDSDAKISSLRTYLVSSIMEHHSDRKNLTTTGFNRNVFKF